ncbi:MAG: S1 RNA-binding domain-containing protein [Candidatus Falkowbacteria bacterium]
MNKTKPTSEFEKLLDATTDHIPQVGDTVQGTVISASKSEVQLDIDGLMTGVVRGRELYYESSDYAKLKPGDILEATVVEPENENGELELSFRHAGQEKTWVNLQEAFANKTSIKMRVNEANRGGLLISYHQVTGFLPVSQLSPENYPRVSGGDKNKILEKLKSLIGKELDVQIITLDKKEEKLVVSEKNAWQERQKDVLSQYKIGDVIEGTITAVTNFGVFLAFGNNLEGLVHISELAWQRIEDPSDLYKVGETLKAEIISINGSKIFLSAKKLANDPWANIQEKYKVGEAHKGTIVKINPFGLFVELEPDIHGLAHISQIALAPGQKIEDKYKVGDLMDFTIMSVEPNEHRLGLTVKSEKKAEKTEQADKAEAAQ